MMKEYNSVKKGKKIITFSIIINSDDVNIVSETSIFDSIGSNLKCLYLK